MSNLSQIAERYAHLVIQIQEADREYYLKDDPSQPDSFYDAWKQELLKIESEYPQFIRPDSPSFRVGGFVAEQFESIPHVTPMLSLANVFDHETLVKRCQGIAKTLHGHLRTVEWVVEPKIDGLALDLRYENGVLVQALTRGDGRNGENVLHNAKTIRTVPLRIRIEPSVLHVRGEVFMTFEDFNLVNKERAERGEKLFANPRNAAAGTLRMLDSKEVGKRRLSFVAYHVAQLEPKITDVPDHTQHDILLALQSWGFKVPDHEVCRNIQEVQDFIDKVDKVRKSFSFPTDGAVVKLDSVEWRKELPGNSQSPGWAFAYKFSATEVETKLTAVTFQVGKTGVIAPVAELEPVEIDGSVVARATLHNFDNMLKLGVRLNDVVVVAKAAEIIPIVLRVETEKRTGNETEIELPTVCPSCSQPIFRVENSDGVEGITWKCGNYDCKAQVIERLQHWCSREAMDIEDVGPAVAEILYGVHVRSPLDLYGRGLIMQLEKEGFGGKRIQNLCRRIEESKARGLEAVLVGLCMPRIGKTLSRKLARAFPDWDAMRAAVDGLNELLRRIPDFGTANLRSLWVCICRKTRYTDLVRGLTNYGVSMKSKTYSEEAASGPFAGKTVCFTGSLEMDRDKARREVEARGGRTTNSVSKKTSLLVAGEDCGSKLDKARTLGVSVITEAEFLKMLE